tara:strand:+ start:288 stop:536 length:249 start_codon:yes stop_codon:yes gene_type:complete
MKGLGMSWSEIKNTPKAELNVLLTALSEYNILHSFDGYNDKAVREMSKEDPSIMSRYNDYKARQRIYNGEGAKITSFTELIK